MDFYKMQSFFREPSLINEAQFYQENKEIMLSLIYKKIEFGKPLSSEDLKATRDEYSDIYFRCGKRAEGFFKIYITYDVSLFDLEFFIDHYNLELLSDSFKIMLIGQIAMKQKCYELLAKDIENEELIKRLSIIKSLYQKAPFISSLNK